VYGVRPRITESSGNLVLTFSCLNAAKRGSAVLNVQQSSDLGISDAWLLAPVPEMTSGTNSLGFPLHAGLANDPIEPVGHSSADELLIHG